MNIVSDVKIHDTAPADVRLESQPCPLCGSAAAVFVTKGFDRINGLPGSFSIVRCNGCSLMRTNPRPTTDTMSFYYPDDYGPYRYTRVEPGQPAPVSKRWKRAIRRLMDTRATAVPDLAPGRMLEIGCASGAFLHAMQRKGWAVQGVEFSSSAAQSARDAGLNVFTGSVDNAPLVDSAYDLIVGWMVFEHLHDPVAALRRLRSAAAPGAYLAFSVPNAAAIDFRLFGNACYALHLPAHLFHFTPQTIRQVLRSTGWRIETLYHQRSAANLVGSLGNLIADHARRSIFAEKMQKFPESCGRIHDVLFPAALLLSLFGQSGRMTIWARPA